MEQWSLIQNQPLLKTINLKPPIISYKRGKSLTHVRYWLLANKLSSNITKTEYIFLTTTFKSTNLGRDFPIKIGNNHVKRVQTTKYLGIHLDENNKWNEHVARLCSKVNRSTSGLKQARDNVLLDVF